MVNIGSPFKVRIMTVVRTISSQFKSLKVRKFPIQNADLYANEPGAKKPLFLRAV